MADEEVDRTLSNGTTEETTSNTTTTTTETTSTTTTTETTSTTTTTETTSTEEEEETLSEKAKKLNEKAQTEIKELASKIINIRDNDYIKSAGATDLTSEVQCPDGYVHLYGNICIKKSVKAQAEDIKKKVLPDLSALMELNSTCRMAVEAMNAISKTAEGLLQIPGQLAGALNDLIDYPFDLASKMVKDAVDTIAGIKDTFLKGLGFDKVSGIISDIKKLKSNLESILSCPLMADTEIGKAAAEILDGLDKGEDITSKVSSLKNYITSYAEDALDNLKEEPLGKVAELQKAIDTAVERSGVKDVLDKLDGLAKCVEMFCDLADTSSSLYTKITSKSSTTLAEKAGMVWKSATKSLSTTFTDLCTKEGNNLEEAWNNVSSLFKTANKKQ